MEINSRIKNRRLSLGKSVDDVAYEINKNRATVYRYENGDITSLPTTVLEPLARALTTTPAYLMGWSDDPNDYTDMDEIVVPNDFLPYDDEETRTAEYVKFLQTVEKENAITDSFNAKKQDFPVFTDPQDAMIFIIKNPIMMNYGGYDINKMSDEEIIEFANQTVDYMKYAAQKYKK